MSILVAEKSPILTTICYLLLMLLIWPNKQKTSAVKRLIASNICFCLHNMYMYCVDVLCIYKHTHTYSIYLRVYIYSYILYCRFNI